MGNIVGSCYVAKERSYVKVIYWDGNTKTLTGKRHIAGEILFEFPESMLCDAECFYIGHTIPSLALADLLKPGKTYLVLPLDIFPSDILSASSVAAFVRCKPRGTPTNLKDCPLEYIKGSSERILIKLKPEFMVKYLTNKGGNCDDQENDVTSSNETNCCLCSTPELKKEYRQLVRSKDQTWSPGLGTISEANKIRYSPVYRFIGLEWQEKEDDAKMGY